ncbi:YbgC/FadM family acyl-CoA thioesterase [Oecophyllibacter saccharovorans]|uniref:YbgC/FadM family acyl-CoA thioesterase n=1 Tax=Oecophyllibacter saccharovorans TaxID=2558360 RepID=UPI00116DA7DB|nr:YbgC/FadM family acyl-CoA thioesterase [Oecophyllibacter saccharovorans]TPW36546.1 YbgC/FadM family acyl-CoA thioesterase [Oecophyllibacter saccharovorans]
MAAHECRFRVYYEDTDAGGVVYHARYLGFAERARAEALRVLGLPVGWLARQKRRLFVVRTLRADYHAPLHLDEEMLVETELAQLRGARLVLAQRIYRLDPDPPPGNGPGPQGDAPARHLAVTLEVTLACLDADSMKPARIPPYCLQKLARLAP